MSEVKAKNIHHINVRSSKLKISTIQMSEVKAKNINHTNVRHHQI
jgi:hypothetical protein